MMPAQQVHGGGDVGGGQSLDPLDAAVVLEDGLLEQRLPLPHHRQPLLGVLQARLGSPEVLLLLAHRRDVLGLLLELAAEDLGLGRGHLLAPPLDLLLPVDGPVLLEPVDGPAHLRLDRPQAASVSSP